jgi:bifunctional non-homologous end joining protein LigD
LGRSGSKFDGRRFPIHLNKERRKVYTRNGLDWTKRFSQIAGALDIPCQAIIDGEVVVIHEGRTNFSELQAELAAGRQERLVFYAFDLVLRDGDLRKVPQIERKQMLSDLLRQNDIGLPIIYSEHLIGDGQEMFEHAAKLNFEGIVSKKLQAVGSKRSCAIGGDRADHPAGVARARLFQIRSKRAHRP